MWDYVLVEVVQGSGLREQVTGELRVFAAEGQAKWRQFDGGSELVCIEQILRERHDLAESSRVDGNTVSDAIEEACEALKGEWRCASLAHLGYAESSPASRVKREEEAAECLVGPDGPMSERTYRGTRSEGRHRGRPFRGRTYDSWSEVTLIRVAEALIEQNGGDPDAPPRADEGTLSQPEARRLGDRVRDECAALHVAIKPEEFTTSFFHRPSTNAYVESLAGLEGATIFFGGAISTELHAPLSDTLVARSLRERLALAAKELNGAQHKRVIDALMRVYPPAHIGSIAREFVRQHSHADPQDIAELEREAQQVFAGELWDALRGGGDTGGFLALALGALAFSMRKAGKSPVQILTTSYDDGLGEAEDMVHRYFEGLSDYRFDPRSLESPAEDGNGSIPLFRLNGHIKGGGNGDPLIIGEADSLTNYYKARSRLIEQALSESACIFIGTELNEPDVLAKLVTAPYPEGQPRYAVLMPPEFDLDSAEERAKVLNLAAQRFLHLGVVPILIDFPHQAPQFLIEVALRLQLGKKGYQSYAKRLQTWWGCWAKEFGFPPGSRAGEVKRDRNLQEIWMKELEKVRDEVGRDHLEISAGSDQGERIQIEVWVRHPDERSLILWSTSDGLWLNPESADRCYIHKGDDVPVQRAFREGTPVYGPVSPPRGEWRYQLSIPLVLRKRPWHHLPVGVVNILSSKDPPEEDGDGNALGTGGKLGAFSKREDFASDLAKLSGTVRRPINALLDTNSPICRRRKLGKPPRGIG